MTTASIAPVAAAPSASVAVGRRVTGRIRSRGLVGRVGKWMAIGRLVGFAPEWAD